MDAWMRSLGRTWIVGFGLMVCQPTLAAVDLADLFEEEEVEQAADEEGPDEAMEWDEESEVPPERLEAGADPEDVMEAVEASETEEITEAADEAITEATDSEEVEEVESPEADSEPSEPSLIGPIQLFGDAEPAIAPSFVAPNTSGSGGPSNSRPSFIRRWFQLRWPAAEQGIGSDSDMTYFHHGIGLRGSEHETVNGSHYSRADDDWLTPERSRRSDSRIFWDASQVPEELADVESVDPFADHIETDRDSFTPSTRTVARRRLIVESAYSFIDNRRSFDTHSLPELVLRYGLTERIELRFGWNYEVGGGGNVVSSVETEEGLEGGRLERESRTLYGFKFRFTEQVDWIPESSFIVQGFTPTSGDATATEVSATYIVGWTFFDDWKLDAGLRYATDGDQGDDFATWAPSIVLRVPLTEQWNVHGEFFSIFPQGQAGARPQHLFSTGLHYLITPDIEIGVRLGWGLNEAAPNFFTNTGIGWRF